MSVESTTVIDPRKSFMKTEGFVLYNDVSEQLLADLAQLPPPTPQDIQDRLNHERHEQSISPGLLRESYMPLYLFTGVLASRTPNMHNSESDDRRDTFGLTANEDLEVKKHTFDQGLDDLDFPWSFSAGVAAQEVHAFVESGKLSAQTAKDLQLDGWADLIGSQHFSNVIHDFARTGFGLYGRFGQLISHLDHPNALRETIQRRLETYYYRTEPELDEVDLFDVTQLESGTGLASLQANINPAHKALLRWVRHNSAHIGESITDGSTGCPVARKAVLLPTDHAKSMPRATHLQKLGVLSISDRANAAGEVLATQESSAIDSTLQFMATSLRNFHNTYGTPKLSVDL